MHEHLLAADTPPGLCEWCGTLVDEGDYQDDGYRHTDGRCVEYLKAALSAANRAVVQARADALEDAARICDREERACESHLRAARDLLKLRKRDYVQHVAGAQIARDCARMIRDLPGAEHRDPISGAPIPRIDIKRDA